MSRRHALVLAAMAGLSGCAATSTTPGSAVDDDDAAAETSDDEAETDLSATVDAIEFTHDGDEALTCVVTLTFENDGEKAASFQDAATLSVYQDGRALDAAGTIDDEIYERLSAHVADELSGGASIQIQAAYLADNTADAVTVRVHETGTGALLASKTFDPAAD